MVENYLDQAWRCFDINLQIVTLVLSQPGAHGETDEKRLAVAIQKISDLLCDAHAESAGRTADTFHDSTAILMDGDIRWVIRRGHRPMMLEWQKRNAENSSNVSRVTLGQRAELSVRTTALCVMGGAKERPAGS
ncbi:hypothetical protein Bbelb_344410 [Branchiostoma belcheri]|nr:hypothetical protein Bbelb_344410 [Branchiostoma belcheri]